MLGWILRYALLGLIGLGLIACGMHVAHSGREPVPPRTPGNLRIASLNVHWIALRQSEGPWSPSGWEARRPAMIAAIEAMAPDILALQEAESFPATNRDGTNLVVESLSQAFPGYGLAATGDPASFPTTQPILYARDRLELVDQGWFFFADTPDQLYARTFNGGWSAFASWAEFRPLTGGAVFRVVNVHTDFSSRSNRRRSASLIRDRIAPVIAGGTPVIVLGDMNAMRGSETLNRISAAGITFLPVRGATFHMNRGVNLFGAIDHIGHSAGLLPVAGPVVLRQRFGGVWPSDHYPVFADFETP